MDIAGKITCPNCSFEFAPEEAITEQLERKLRAELEQANKVKEDAFRQKELAILKTQQDLETQKISLQKELNDKLTVERQKIVEEERRKLSDSHGEYLRKVEDEKKTLTEEKLKKENEAREKELELIKLRNENENQRKAIELEFAQKAQTERAAIEETIRKAEQERVQMQLAERDKQLEDQKKLIAEMQRKAEQGSMQMQGEVMELALEEVLRTSFPFDLIEEVAKGVRGADVIQTVRNTIGADCGKIIYETKRTKNFEHGWIEKLKADMLSQGAEIAVLVTEALPKELDRFGSIDGVWVCTFKEVKPLTFILRESLIKVSQAIAAQENKGDKMVMLYDYLSGNEFRLQIEAIVEGFTSMRMSIIKERAAMERIWKEREKQLDKVLLNTTGFYGAIKGIAGASIPEIKMLDLDNTDGDTDLLNP